MLHEEPARHPRVDVWEMLSRSEDETRSLGKSLGATLDRGAVVLLVGEMGAGKTMFAQGLCHGLGVDGWANSPTFTLINEHQGRVRVYHCDFYRLADAAELSTLALDDVLYGDGVALIEWPEIAEEWLPEEAIRVTITRQSPTERHIRVEGVARPRNV